MAEIVTLPPKTIKFRAKQSSCEIKFVKHVGKWTWCISVPVKPQLVAGEANTEKEARDKVHQMLKHLYPDD